MNALLMDSLMDLSHKTVTVLGAARSGIAAANLVVKLGGMAKLSEFRSKADFNADINDLDQKVICEFGGHSKDFIERSDYVVLSPGIRRDCQPVQWALAKGIPVLGEIELAYRCCPAPIIAVTGSNGKTTVSTLIAECLKKDGRKVFLCGNIGLPFAKVINQITPDSFVVLEVSSFQLESTERFRPHIGVLLNFSENHLDRHKDLDEYFQAKSRMLANQQQEDFAILNYDNPRIRKLQESLRAQVLFYNSPGKNEIFGNPNERAVVEAVRVLGVSPEVCHEVFRKFKGVEHRMELVRTLDGVDYINDSKSTTAEATRWALERLTKPAYLICGGRDKNIDFSVLKPLVKKKVRKILAIGEARDKVFQTFCDVLEVDRYESLESAVLAARQQGKSGECVLISPMCASFDMFKNFEHRGQVFKEIVNQLV